MRKHQYMSISESGKIYSFGANGEGQLGVEDSPSSNVPKCIDSLVIQQYTMLAAGADHSVALSGKIFLWFMACCNNCCTCLTLHIPENHKHLQGCGNTIPDLSDLVPFHSGQVEIFYLLVLGQVQMY